MLNGKNRYHHKIKYAIPSGNYTIDFCYYMELPRDVIFKKIEIEYKTDLNVYFHYPGQFFQTWREKRNLITTLTPLTVLDLDKIIISLHDLNVNLLLDRYYGISSSVTEDHDSCVLSQYVNSTLSINDFVMFNMSSSTWGNYLLTKDMLRNVHNLIYFSHENCKYPTNYINMKIIPSAMRQKRDIKKSDEYGSDSFMDENTRLDESHKKPSVHINLPKYARVLKVYIKLKISYDRIS